MKQVLQQAGIPTEFAYEGFLYGHYDSRGGTTFIEAKTKKEADLRYLREVCGDEHATEADVTGPVEDQPGWLGDYLGAATLGRPPHRADRPGRPRHGDGVRLGQCPGGRRRGLGGVSPLR